jgi:hypothetical protein
MLLIVLLAIHSGMRKSELLNLRWPKMDFAFRLAELDAGLDCERHAALGFDISHRAIHEARRASA